MTYIFSPSNYAHTATDWIFQWKQFMKTAGWRVVASSDGYSGFDLTSDIITNYSSGPNGLSNSYAWFVIQSPSNINFCFQRGATEMCIGE